MNRTLINQPGQAHCQLRFLHFELAPGQLHLSSSQWNVFPVPHSDSIRWPGSRVNRLRTLKRRIGTETSNSTATAPSES